MWRSVLAAKKTRHQEVEKTPDFAQMVFHRRARQTQALASLQLANDLRSVGAGILDVLRFVEDDEVPLCFQPEFTVAL